jgi:hypothetical protein
VPCACVIAISTEWMEFQELVRQLVALQRARRKMHRAHRALRIVRFAAPKPSAGGLLFHRLGPAGSPLAEPSARGARSKTILKWRIQFKSAVNMQDTVSVRTIGSSLGSNRFLGTALRFAVGVLKVTEISNADHPFRKAGGNFKRTTKRLYITLQIADIHIGRFSSLATLSPATGLSAGHLGREKPKSASLAPHEDARPLAFADSRSR